MSDYQQERYFGDVINTIKTSREQKSLSSRTQNKSYQACLFVVWACVVLGLAVFQWTKGISTIFVILHLIGFVVLLLLAYVRQTEALMAAKKQDRAYFLESIRAAESVDELNFAGLFAPGHRKVDVEEERRRLIRALSATSDGE